MVTLPGFLCIDFRSALLLGGALATYYNHFPGRTIFPPFLSPLLLNPEQDNAVRYFQVSRGKLLKKSEKLPNSKTGVIVSLSCHKIEAGSTIAVSRYGSVFKKLTFIGSETQSEILL